MWNLIVTIIVQKCFWPENKFVQKRFWTFLKIQKCFLTKSEHFLKFKNVFGQEIRLKTLLDTKLDKKFQLRNRNRAKSNIFCPKTFLSPKTLLNKDFELKNSTKLLYFPISSSAETWKIFRNMLCQFFFRLSWHFKREKPVFWKASFLQNKDWLRVQASCTRLCNW